MLTQSVSDTGSCDTPPPKLSNSRTNPPPPPYFVLTSLLLPLSHPDDDETEDTPAAAAAAEVAAPSSLPLIWLCCSSDPEPVRDPPALLPPDMEKNPREEAPSTVVLPRLEELPVVLLLDMETVELASSLLRSCLRRPLLLLWYICWSSRGDAMVSETVGLSALTTAAASAEVAPRSGGAGAGSSQPASEEFGEAVDVRLTRGDAVEMLPPSLLPSLLPPPLPEHGAVLATASFGAADDSFKAFNEGGIKCCRDCCCCS